jgi:hypothetical protein
VRVVARSALTLALVLFATAAHAGAGVNLRWDSCYGDAGMQNKSFACNTNTGSDVLVCSFEVATEVLQASGQEVVIDLVASAATLPAWWAFKNAGTCRQLSLAMSTTLSPTAVVCSDWSSGHSFGGIGAYNIGFSGPSSAQIRIATAMATEFLADLFPGTEYFVCNLVINHAKTIGTGACAGCTVPVCIVFGDKITTPVAANDVLLIGGANGPGSIFATWQGPTNPDPFGCPWPLPTLRSSWGAVKALYR